MYRLQKSTLLVLSLAAPITVLVMTGTVYCMCCCNKTHCTAFAIELVLPTEKYFTDAVTGGSWYSLGNDWNSVLRVLLYSNPL
jgi:hypothetical protein